MQIEPPPSQWTFYKASVHIVKANVFSLLKRYFRMIIFIMVI